jgi:membrane-bound lytic murein transglycosylase D
MMINDSIDERRSPFKASEAAARLLKENHLILHRQWPLALTAYNHGPAGVRAAIKATGTKDLGTIAMKYRTKMFNFASANFYSSFLAALHAQIYKDKIWGELAVDPALETYFVRLPKAYKASKLLKVTGLSEENLLLHNPDFRKILASNGVLPSGLRVYLPDSLRQKVQKIFAENVALPKSRRKG